MKHIKKFDELSETLKGGDIRKGDISRLKLNKIYSPEYIDELKKLSKSDPYKAIDIIKKNINKIKREVAPKITTDDIIIVCNKLGTKIDETKAKNILIKLKRKKIVDAALYIRDIDEQTNYIHEEIEKQIKELNLLEESSNYAFEVTPEDIITVCNELGTTIDEIKANSIISKLDMKKIVDAALFGDDIDEQTEYAHEEIKDQIKELELLKEAVGDAAEDQFILDDILDRTAGDPAKMNQAQKDLMKDYGGNTHYAAIKKYRDYLKVNKAGKETEKTKESAEIVENIGDYVVKFIMDKKEGANIFGTLSIIEDDFLNEYTGRIITKDNKPYIVDFKNDNGVDIQNGRNADFFKDFNKELRNFFNKVVSELV